jgi:hypothetical protein
MNTQAQEVPLIELLKAVPKTARLIVESEDGISSRAHPVGDLCHKAAEALETKQVCENAAPAQEPVAWMLPNENLVNYKDVAEFLCEEGQTPIPLYTHPAQPLSEDEIQKTWYNLYPLDENNLWTDMLEGEHLRKFARAIEKAHGIGENDGQAYNGNNVGDISSTCD